MAQDRCGCGRGYPHTHGPGGMVPLAEWPEETPVSMQAVCDALERMLPSEPLPDATAMSTCCYVADVRTLRAALPALRKLVG